MKYLRWIWQNTLGIRLNSAVRIVVGIIQVMLGLLMVWLSKQFIDVTIRTGSREELIAMTATLVATVLSGILLRQLYYYLTTKASIHQSNSIRLRVFSNLFLRKIFDDQQLHSGDVTSRMSKDIDTVADVTTTMIPQLLVTFTQLAGAFCLLYSMDAALALSLLLATPLVAVLSKFIAHRLRAMTLDIRQQESTIQMQVQESMEYNAVLRSLGSERWVTNRLDGMQQELVGHVMRRTRFTIVTRLLLSATFALGYLAAFLWGGLQLRSGAITFGVMTSFLQLVGQIQHPILNILNMLPQFFYATASIDRLQEMEDSAADTQQASANSRQSSAGTAQSTTGSQKATADSADPLALPADSDETAEIGIMADSVSFSYSSDERQILTNFTHDFKPGSKTAIMGETGIGKTTLFRLMLALIEPQQGSITVYDNDGHRQPVSTSTRRHFVFVPQGNTLMSGTVRYNLLLACPTATDEQLRDVLHTAMADFVETLPGGLDCTIGERGIGLSEGQAQRIAIARGLLRPGNILLLDEISSSLDEETESELFRRLFHAKQKKTMIFITHRPAVSTLCDDVIAMKSE